MDVSIVIVSYNTCKLLDECIISIKKETTVAYEIIVVDNASVDNTCQMLREKYPEIRLIENKGNVGFARANNQGFALAVGKYYCMLNPDTVILDRAIDILVSFMEGNYDVGICGPRNIGKDGQLQYSCDHFPSTWNIFCYYSGLSSIFSKSVLFDRGLMRYWDYGKIKDVDRMVGCSLLIRSSLYKQLGGLDENYFMYFEETDLCYQARKSDTRVTYVPHAVIIHYGGESAQSFHKNIVVGKTVPSFFYASQYRFFRKNYGLLSMLSVRFLELIYGTIMLLLSYLRWDTHKRQQGVNLGKFIVKAALHLSDYVNSNYRVK